MHSSTMAVIFEENETEEAESHKKLGELTTFSSESSFVRFEEQEVLD